MSNKLIEKIKFSTKVGKITDVDDICQICGMKGGAQWQRLSSGSK